MDTNEIKRILDESSAEFARILDDCRHGPDENVRIVDIMEPILQDLRELQEQVFYDIEQTMKGNDNEQ